MIRRRPHNPVALPPSPTRCPPHPESDSAPAPPGGPISPASILMDGTDCDPEKLDPAEAPAAATEPPSDEASQEGVAEKRFKSNLFTVLRLLRHRSCLAWWLVLGSLCSMIMLNVLYFSYQTLTMVDACELAEETLLALQDAQSQHNSAPLPKIIHQVWKDDNIPPGRFTECRAAWKRLFPEPEYTHILWTDSSARTLMEQEFSWFLPYYDAYPMNIQRADAMRYFILYKYGGLYADLDYEPLENFWKYLPSDRVALVESPYIMNEQVQNSLMSSPARDAFWNATFGVLAERSGGERILSSTGPAAVGAAIRRHDRAVQVLPCRNFQRVPVFGREHRERAWNVRLAQWLRYRSPQVRHCGDWTAANDCQFGIHHNAVSYESEFTKDARLWSQNA